MDFADKLKLLRKETRLSQYDLAKDLNVSRSSIAGYEVRDRLPDYDALKKISLYFNVSIDWLLGVSENRNRILSKEDIYENRYKVIFKDIEDRLVKENLLKQHGQLSEATLELIVKHGLDSAIEILKLKKRDE